jgi:hypothetical protein
MVEKKMILMGGKNSRIKINKHCKEAELILWKVISSLKGLL